MELKAPSSESLLLGIHVWDTGQFKSFLRLTYCEWNNGSQHNKQMLYLHVPSSGVLGVCHHGPRSQW